MNGLDPNKGHNFTIVTCIYDLNRESIGQFSRPFSFYINNLLNLLKLDFNFVVFTDSNTRNLLKKEHGSFGKNIVFVEKELDQLKRSNIDIYKNIQKIRSNPDWYKKTDWLEKSPQAKLEYYNMLVMSKMFFLHDAKIHNFFNDDYLFWLDSGINNTITNEKLANIQLVPDISREKFLFTAFPYSADNGEIHGFDKAEMDNFAQESVTHVCRGGFFGGHKDCISQANDFYYNLLTSTLNEGLMGTEENAFTLMNFLDKDSYPAALIKEDGLIYSFFDDLKEDKVKFREEKSIYGTKKEEKTAIYVLTFECPTQLRSTLSTFYRQEEFGYCKYKYLVDNSENYNNIQENQKIAKNFGFKYIKTEKNLGVSGGRQFVAELFHNSDYDYYFFFEDDMTISDSSEVDKFGFPKYVNFLYENCHKIVKKEKLDYLKLNFTEFYGENDKQWAFLNLDKGTRLRYYPSIKRIKAAMPPTEIEKIGNIGTSYLVGDFHYCNWPCLFTKEGNKKLFIDDKLITPHEQIWMLKNFKLQKDKKIRTGVLLASPITHIRSEFYEAIKRKEC